MDDPHHILTTSSYCFLRKTNDDEAKTKFGCLDNCLFEDSENDIFCFKSGLAVPATILSTSKQLKHTVDIFVFINFYLITKKAVFGKGIT